MNSLLIYSGGMDSTVLLYKTRPKLAIGFDYGQKHRKELFYAAANCATLKIPWLLVNLSNLKSVLKSALTDSKVKVPHGHYTDESQKITIVPFRNGIMLAIAVGIAESKNLDSVYIANHAGDHPIYPDCRPEFIEIFSRASMLGTYEEIDIEAPFSALTKREVALIGKKLKVPFENTWSCYEGGERHCGQCGTCVERKEALEGFDPTEYIA